MPKHIGSCRWQVWQHLLANPLERPAKSVFRINLDLEGTGSRQSAFPTIREPVDGNRDSPARLASNVSHLGSRDGEDGPVSAMPADRDPGSQFIGTRTGQLQDGYGICVSRVLHPLRHLLHPTRLGCADQTEVLLLLSSTLHPLIFGKRRRALYCMQHGVLFKAALQGAEGFPPNPAHLLRFGYCTQTIQDIVDSLSEAPAKSTPIGAKRAAGLRVLAQDGGQGLLVRTFIVLQDFPLQSLEFACVVLERRLGFGGVGAQKIGTSIKQHPDFFDRHQPAHHAVRLSDVLDEFSDVLNASCLLPVCRCQWRDHPHVCSCDECPSSLASLQTLSVGVGHFGLVCPVEFVFHSRPRYESSRCRVAHQASPDAHRCRRQHPSRQRSATAS